MSELNICSRREADRLLETGFSDLVGRRAVNGQKAGSLVGTPRDVLGIAIHVPLVLESLRTALTGQVDAEFYRFSAICVLRGVVCFCPLRGTEWWERVQSLHPNQAALMGVSILVAIVGDTSGNLLLRMQQLRFFQSEAAIVVCGVTLLLLFPEIIFHTLYSSGVSEFGFYWE